MGLFHAVFLGIIQGLTEFLPISSSGHLVLFQYLFGIKEPEIFFDVAVHMGTLMAVCIFFSRELKGIARVLFSVSTWSGGDENFWQPFIKKPEMRLLTLIIVGTIPTGVIGLAFRSAADTIFSSVRLVGGMLLVTGLILWFTRGLKKGGRNTGEMTLWDGLTVGLMQGVAVLPGISRSGATIGIALLRGLDREAAACYSFLLSIPAILGAMTLELYQARGSVSPAMAPVLLGACAAGLVGYGALKVLVHILKKGELYVFAPYCWLVGAIAIGWSFLWGC
ncbi:MAG: undecaprenyl-diphosphate phosphatase [Deltaproteobacteria bacterium]|nr:undecaprenyl-diphosphate phosphatase [Deltaproteobacteria bacterium]